MVEDHADGDWSCTYADSRYVQHIAKRAARADREGIHAQIDERRCRLSSRSEAGDAADYQQRAAQSKAAGAISICGGDDRFHRWAGLSHCYHAPAYGDGYHSSLLAVGRAAAL